MFWQRANWKQRYCRMVEKNSQLLWANKELLKTNKELYRLQEDRADQAELDEERYEDQLATVRKLRELDAERIKSLIDEYDAATQFIGPNAAAWLSQLDDITTLVEDMKEGLLPLQNGYYKTGHLYPWQDEEDYDDTGQ